MSFFFSPRETEKLPPRATSNMNRKIVSIASNLLFTSRIQEATNRAGLDLHVLRKAKNIVSECLSINPRLVLIDLEMDGLDVQQVLWNLKKASTTRGITVIGYLSHTDDEKRQQALLSGCDEALARSVFFSRLPKILSELASAKERH